MFLIKDKNDAHARRPTELRYMKIIRYLLRMLCSWPHQFLGEETQTVLLRNNCSLFVEGLGVVIGGVIYVNTHYSKVTFLEMGQTYLTICLGVVAAQRVTVSWFQSYKQMMKVFLREMHLFHHRHNNEFCEHMYQYIHRICDVFVIVVLAQTIFGVILFNLTPLFSNYRRGMFNREVPPGQLFEHSINFFLPFIDQFSNLAAYIIVFIMNLLFSYDCGLCFLSHDLTLAVIVFHIWGHLKILDHSLKSIPKPLEMRGQNPGRVEDELSYTKEQNKMVASKLKDIVDHHRLIMSFMKTTSDAYGPTLCLYYLFHQVTGCILLLECSALDANSLIRYGAFSVVVIQLLIQISIIVEILGSQSETLKDAVYSVPWEYMDASNRRVVLFLLYNVQKPIRLKPMGIVSVGVQTMATILKTSFSYFMLLRTFD